MATNDLKIPGVNYEESNIPTVGAGVFSEIEKEDMEKLSKFLGKTSEELQARADKDAKYKARLIKMVNDLTRKDYAKQLEDIKGTAEEYEESIAERRRERADVLEEAKQTIGMESQIQAARIGDAGRYTRGQLAKISGDISRNFMNSLIKAKTDAITFNEQLDTKLKQLGFDVADKEKLYTDAKGLLKDEEIAPILDAIAAKAKTNEEFTKIFSQFLSDTLKTQLAKTAARREEETKIEYDAEAYGKMSSAEKKNWVRNKLSNVINMTDEQKEDFLSVAMTKDPYEVNALLNTIRIKGNTMKDAFISSMEHTKPAEGVYEAMKNYFKIDVEAPEATDTPDTTGEPSEEPGTLTDEEKEKIKQRERINQFNNPTTLEGYQKYVNAVNNYYKPAPGKEKEVSDFIKGFKDTYGHLNVSEYGDPTGEKRKQYYEILTLELKKLIGSGAYIRK